MDYKKNIEEALQRLNELMKTQEEKMKALAVKQK